MKDKKSDSGPKQPDNQDVVIVRRVATPARRKKLVRLLSILMDKDDAKVKV